MRKSTILIMIQLLVWAAPAFAATAALQDKEQLLARLERNIPCCVIDARIASHQKQKPIAESVTYRAGLQINPAAGGFALVVGDSDAKALKIAQTLSKESGQDVYAVKGGYETWDSIGSGAESAGSPAEVDPTAPKSFVIPKNTCEQGKPIQVFQK